MGIFPRSTEEYSSRPEIRIMQVGKYLAHVVVNGCIIYITKKTLLPHFKEKFSPDKLAALAIMIY